MGSRRIGTDCSMALGYELGYARCSAGWYFTGGLGVGEAAGRFAR